ncbi:MAG: hypothetical protein R3Y08_05635 [Rikenellaceae bacterium]
MKSIKISILSVIAALSILPAAAQSAPKEALWQGKGRIVISSDGNEHDWDDWAASAMNLAVLASQGLQDKLTLYTYSDHVWGSNQEHPNVNGMNAYEHVKESITGGARYFDFDTTKFICAVDNAEVAYNAMRDEINRSSAESPLFIIGAGPMQVIGEGMNRADSDKLKYVTIISHSGWNNNHSDKVQSNFIWDVHSGWTWDEMIEAFGAAKHGASFVKIKDQNHGWDKYIALQCPREHFDWLVEENAPESWRWLHFRLESCAVKQKRYFDVSDTGMIVYLLTGNENVSPQMIEQFLRKEN